MIQRFSKNTADALKYYVYVYSDPDTKKPFYVGKGKGNKAFTNLTNTSEIEKTKKINEIEENGKSPIIEIIAYGLDEETALKVESGAIDLIGIENLTNRQKSLKSSAYGKIKVSQLEAMYNQKKLNPDDIIDNIMFIRINKRYRNDMTPLELYEATRGYWRLKIENAKEVDYVLAVYDGMVLEVYEVADWFSALSTYMDRQGKSDPDSLKGRYEFVGKIADEDIRKRYAYKSVKGFFKYGEANPIKYVWGRK